MSTYSSAEKEELSILLNKITTLKDRWYFGKKIHELTADRSGGSMSTLTDELNTSRSSLYQHRQLFQRHESWNDLKRSLRSEYNTSSVSWSQIVNDYLPNRLSVEKDTVLYLLRIRIASGQKAYKVGVTENLDKRVARLIKRKDYKILLVTRSISINERAAYKNETKIVRGLRELNFSCNQASSREVFVDSELVREIFDFVIKKR